MGILNVNKIQPVGSGQTVTVSATNINAGSATLTAGTFTGNLTGNVTGNVTSSSTSTFSNGLNVTGGSVGIGTDSPVSGVKLHLQDTSACRIQLSTDNTGHTSSDGVRLMIDSSNNFEILNRENASIEFFTNDTQRWSINSTGNLVAASSGLGIDFSAASGSAAGSSSAVLDDYEEGTWTPEFNTTNDNWSGTYSSQAGVYTKIGRQVTLAFRIQGVRSGGTGAFQISGLPFDAVVIDRFVVSISPTFGGGWGATNAPCAGFIAPVSRMIFKKSDGSDARIQADTNVDASLLGSIGMIATVTYFAA